MAYLTNKVKNTQGTSIYVNDAIKQGLLYEGVNNITQTNSDLPFMLNLNYYSQENPYKEVIYSQDDVNDIRIWFNDIELENAGDYVELLTMTNRILPNDGLKRFSLSNFVAKTLELTIHDIDIETIQEQVKISIGTLVDNSYEYVPIGVFNIEDTPVNNHDKYVIKLIDNRVKFDFNYNAQPLIDSQYIVTTDTTYQENKSYYSLVSATYVLLVVGTDYEVGDAIVGTIYQKKGTATKGQILNDICSQAGVVNNVGSFDGDSDEIGIYDSTISANLYVPYLAEQGGYIPTIDRLGQLIFVDLSDLYTWRIPLSIISDDYYVGTKYKIERVVYESGIIKYETSNDESLDTLYLNAANPYITNQSQITLIYNKLKDFEIDSVVVNNNFLGNPAIDPYDIIEVYDDEDVEEPVIFRTLANGFYTFNGKHSQTIDTQIGVEQRTENVSKNSEETFRKWATTSIDAANAEIELKVGVNEVISKINLSTEAAEIEANKISLAGKEIELTADNISISSDNFNVDTDGNLQCTNADVSGKITADDGEISGFEISTNPSDGTKYLMSSTYAEYDYTYADWLKVKHYLDGTETLTPEEIEKYDLNKDGVVNGWDFEYLTRIRQLNITTSRGIHVQMNTNPLRLDLNGISMIAGDTTVFGAGTFWGVTINNGQALGMRILFEDSNGDNGTITLRDEIDEDLGKTFELTSYRFIEVFGIDNNRQDGAYIKLANTYANGNSFTLSMTEAVTGMYIRKTKYTVANDNQLVPSNGGYIYITSNGSVQVNSSQNYIYITKVVGYK